MKDQNKGTQKQQVYNPFLPLNEYIPDGEPHVFGDRVYHFGSHDKEGGYTFCMLDYVAYSAPVTDLSDWRYEGVIYQAKQDPRYPDPQYMYAPDVVQGNDGRYYLYYCMGGDYGQGGYQGPIGVAVCEEPAGQYEYLGVVKNPDGSPMMKYICFDPAALNDNGTIRIYYGTQYDYEEREDFMENDSYMQEEIEMFGRSREEILSYPDSIMGACMVVLEDDMLTVKEEARHIIPYRVKGTGFETHPFFEGSSMRKVGDRYYFVYSSWQNHELCYATSRYPDRDFIFGGTIVSNGDIGYQGRTVDEKLNMTGTTHGSIVEINGQWYVFYHRLTHKSDYSRQACAEKIQILEDGRIPQVEITSCGLNDGPLKGEGRYPAVIACNLTNGHMPHGSNSIFQIPFPNVTNLGEERFIAEIEDGTLIGYKYFECSGVTAFGISARTETDANRVVYQGPLRTDERSMNDDNFLQYHKEEKQSLQEKAGQKDMDAYIELFTDPEQKISVGMLDVSRLPEIWTDIRTEFRIPDGVYGIYLVYHGAKKLQLREIFLETF